MKLTMWLRGKYQTIDLNNNYIYICKCGSGHTVFAKAAKFVKETTQHFVWELEDGRRIKTKDNGYGVGQAKDLFLMVRNEPLQFCDPEKGIRTNYIDYLIF